MCVYLSIIFTNIIFKKKKYFKLNNFFSRRLVNYFSKKKIENKEKEEIIRFREEKKQPLDE